MSNATLDGIVILKLQPKAGHPANCFDCQCCHCLQTSSSSFCSRVKYVCICSMLDVCPRGQYPLLRLDLAVEVCDSSHLKHTESRVDQLSASGTDFRVHATSMMLFLLNVKRVCSCLAPAQCGTGGYKQLRLKLIQYIEHRHRNWSGA